MSEQWLSPKNIAGEILGHYGVVEKIGEGGMGVVYKGWDTHLDRPVALKVLLPQAVSRPEARQRFILEAKAASALNHPNIVTIYDISHTNGVDYIAMEYVEGSTLEELISQGPLPPAQALAYALQMTDALGRAHAAGIVHRDLKPSNLMITLEDHVKILDFGLAKLMHASSGTGEASPSQLLTREGRMVGTMAYMAPEQADGRPVDGRTDIFSFGLILYEMLTGKRPFGSLGVLATALTDDTASLKEAAATLPLGLERAVMRCLRQEPQRRWQSMQDLRAVLEDLRELSPQRKFWLQLGRRFSLAWVTLTVGLLFALGLGLAVGRYSENSAPPSVIRSLVKVDPGLWLDGVRKSVDGQRPNRTAMVMSRRGDFLVLSAIKENPSDQDISKLYLRRMEQAQSTPIAGTEGGFGPFLSPDERWVGFWADGKLKKVPLEGGPAAVLCDAADPADALGASWATDNTIVFAKEHGLYRVSANGGPVEVLTAPNSARDEYCHRLPHCLPGGRGVLFTIMKEPLDLNPRLALFNLKTRQWRVLREDAADARYLPTGHVIFLQQGTLMMAPFHLGKGEILAQPMPVLSNVMQSLNCRNFSRNSAAGQYCVSESGSLVYAAGGILPDMQNAMLWVDQAGREEAAASFKAPFFIARLSPDGRRIAYSTLGRESVLWIYDTERGTTTRLANEGRILWIAWTRDGKKIISSVLKQGVDNLYWQDADASGGLERLTTSPRRQFPSTCSPDGKHLAFLEARADKGWDINLLDLSNRRSVPFISLPADNCYAEFSPDGRWMAYVTDETGRREVYVRSLEAGQSRSIRISREGGRGPLWSPDGKKLYFRSLSGHEVWEANVRTAGAFSAAKARCLFKSQNLLVVYPVREWDIARDGRRFLMIKDGVVPPSPVTELTLVTNWFQEIQRLVPAG